MAENGVWPVNPVRRLAEQGLHITDRRLTALSRLTPTQFTQKKFENMITHLSCNDDKKIDMVEYL